MRGGVSGFWRLPTRGGLRCLTFEYELLPRVAFPFGRPAARVFSYEEYNNEYD